MTGRPPLRKVLLVDDEPDIRLVARMALEAVGGLQVRECEAGAAAVAEVGRWSPDLVLLDVMMPGMDGPATLVALRDLPTGRDLPVVFMTARIQREEVDEYLALGAAGVVGKPFDPMTLSARLHGIWGGLPAPAQALPPPGDPLDDMVARVAARFTSTFPEVGRQLEAAVAASQDQVVRAIAHRVRGTAGTLGLAGVTDAAGALEDELRAGRPLQVLGSQVEAFRRALAQGR